MSNIRPAAVSGMFYPAEQNQLAGMIQDFMKQCTVADTPAPKAIIAPHAGYIYSGMVAAYAYQSISNATEVIRRVILIGPSHRVFIPGLATSSADAFSTPLGDVTLDREFINELLELPQVRVVDEAHQLEHSLEVQLPFLQTVLHDFSIVPLVVGDASPHEVAEVLEKAWGGDETLIVISSDLSHYHDYDTALRMDRHTSDAIVNLQPDSLNHEDACGRIAIQGLLTIAERLGLHPHCLKLANSGDSAGDKNQVVGYGAYSFT